MSSLVVAGHRWMFRESSALAAHPETCLFIEDGWMDLEIPVSRLTQMDTGIKEALASHLNHYCESLRGILISYSKLRLLSPNIDLSEVPSNQQEIRIHGTFVIFRPEKGKMLKGVITRVNPHHIGCLVMKTFTASLRSNAGSNINFEGLYNQDEEITFVVDKLMKDGFSRITGILTDDLIMSHRNSQPSGTVYRNTDDVYPLMVQAEAETLRKKSRKPAQSSNQSTKGGISPGKLAKNLPATLHQRGRSPDSGISPGATEKSTSFPSSSLEDFVSTDAMTISSSSKKKHRREKKLEDDPDDQVLEEVSSSPKKKKKKRHHDEIAVDESLPECVEAVFEEISSPPKKRKKKRNLSENEVSDFPEKIPLEISSEIPLEIVSEDTSAAVPRKKKSKKRRRETRSDSPESVM